MAVEAAEPVLAAPVPSGPMDTNTAIQVTS